MAIKHQNIREAIIMAGGRGERLLPKTADLPKPLIKIGKFTLIEIILKRLRMGSVRRVHLAVNHLAERIEALVGDGSQFDLEINYSHEESPLSTVGPITLIKDLPEHFIVANSDIITDLNIDALFSYHIKQQAELTIATCQRFVPFDYGVIKADENNRIYKFSEKPNEGVIVSMGIYVFAKKTVEYIPKGETYGFDQLVQKLLEKKREVFCFPWEGYWIDIGQPEAYAKADEDSDHILKLLKID